MERDEISRLIDSIVEDSPWQDEKKREWYLNDGSLREVIEAESRGLFEPPKIFYHLKKNFFEKLLLDKNLWGVVVIRGPRRVGKTSTLKYLVKTMIEEGYDRKSFFYISLDNEKLFFALGRKKMLREILRELINKFEKQKPLIIILDEVTFYKGWARAIKNLVDSGEIGRGIGVIATGSYSLDLSTAKAELPGRFGPLGERLGGDILFPPRRFVEVAESLLGSEFREFLSKNFGKVGRRLGTLEFLGGFQTEANNLVYDYESRIEILIDKFYDDLHGILEIYMFSGGYPRAFFEAIISQQKGNMKISDARYRDDIYELFVADCRKFRLDENTLKKILLNLQKPSMHISSTYDTLTRNISLKKDEIFKYIKYFKSSGLFDFIPSISSPDEININTKSVIPSGKKLKLLVTDPAAFISFYLCSRNVHNIFEKSKTIISGNIKELLFEAVAVSHLRYLPLKKPFQNIGYILKIENKKERELSDAFIWYINHENKFIRIPIEIKYTKNFERKEIKEKAEMLKDFGSKRLIIVSNTKKFEIEKDYVIIPAEIYLLLL